MKDLQVIFMGTPEFSVPVLEELIRKCKVIGVVTQPDKIVGKNKEKSFSPIKEIAVKNQKTARVYNPILRKKMIYDLIGKA